MIFLLSSEGFVYEFRKRGKTRGQSPRCQRKKVFQMGVILCVKCCKQIIKVKSSESFLLNLETWRHYTNDLDKSSFGGVTRARA